MAKILPQCQLVVDDSHPVFVSELCKLVRHRQKEVQSVFLMYF